MDRHRKILLVDDDTDDQLLFAVAIKELDPSLECGIAGNGIEALNYLNSFPPPPSLIFLDLNMPLMNGFECLEVLKRTNNYRNIPVIIFTTSNHPVDIERTMTMGAARYMTKPPDFDILKEQLGTILSSVISGGYLA